MPGEVPPLHNGQTQLTVAVEIAGCDKSEVNGGRT
jgi:hypothetical protein